MLMETKVNHGSEGDKQMTSDQLRWAYNESMDWADIYDYGVDARAGIVFAYLQLEFEISGTDDLSHVNPVSAEVRSRYQTLLGNQRRYVARIDDVDARSRHAQGKVQGIYYLTDDGDCKVRPNLLASSRGSWALRKLLRSE